MNGGATPPLHHTFSWLNYLSPGIILPIPLHRKNHINLYMTNTIYLGDVSCPLAFHAVVPYIDVV
jgi:hypothetical protein